MNKRNTIGAIRFLIFGLILLVSCSSNEQTNNNTKPETGSFTDPRDGKIYKTVKIGEQWIMAENLVYKPDSGNYWAYDDKDSNIAIYGFLYDWKTAMNIAPEGWHLPSRKEWFALLKTLGAKRTTFPHLEKVYPKLVVGGSSGLDMQLGGVRHCNGQYKALGDWARYWNSDNTGSEKACYGLNRNKDSIPHGLRGSKKPFAFNNGYQKTCPGYSVRLFKD